MHVHLRMIFQRMAARNDLTDEMRITPRLLADAEEGRAPAGRRVQLGPSSEVRGRRPATVKTA